MIDEDNDADDNLLLKRSGFQKMLMVIGKYSDLMQTLISQRTFFCLCGSVLFDDVVGVGIIALKVLRRKNACSMLGMRK